MHSTSYFTADKTTRQVPDLHPIARPTPPIIPSVAPAAGDSTNAEPSLHSALQKHEMPESVPASFALPPLAASTVKLQEEPKEEPEVDVENIDQTEDLPTDLTAKRPPVEDLKQPVPMEVDSGVIPASSPPQVNNSELVEPFNETSPVSVIESPVDNTKARISDEDINREKKIVYDNAEPHHDNNNDAIEIIDDTKRYDAPDFVSETSVEEAPRRSRASVGRGRNNSLAAESRCGGKVTRSRSGRKRTPSPPLVKTRARRSRELPVRRGNRKRTPRYEMDVHEVSGEFKCMYIEAKWSMVCY